jgi:hypothetical protein
MNMAHHYRPRSTPRENLLLFLQGIPWKFFVLVPILILAAIPAFYFGLHVGKHIFPNLTNYFYKLSGPPPSATPTPQPSFSVPLPQFGSILYTVQEADSCDGILSVQMNMTEAGTIFSSALPNTITALNAAVGQNCNDLQPGQVLTLSPQYPLVALGGRVLKVTATSPQQALPTPLINIATQQPSGIDCSQGCQLLVEIAPSVQVNLYVQTALPVKVGSWVWAQAALARKNVKDFPNYPYVDPNASLNGMSLRACDLQVDNTHDPNSLSCDQLSPNTIDADGGSWLFGVTSVGGLDHWGYPLHVPPNTPVLIWLTNNNGNLSYHNGNRVYTYDAAMHIYVRL